MSLESAIADLTTALNKNSALLELANAGRDKALKAATTLSDKVTGRPPGAADKEPRKKPGDKKKGPPTEQDIRTVFGGYMSVEDPADREKRKAFVKSMLDHLGVAKATEIEEGDRAKAIAWIEQKAAGKKVNFSDGEDDSVEDDPEEEDVLG
jgi:hypothetical protein